MTKLFTCVPNQSVHNKLHINLNQAEHLIKFILIGFLLGKKTKLTCVRGKVVNT